MPHPNYAQNSIDSILDYASLLTGKRLRDFLTLEQQCEILNDKKNKGQLGTLVEKYFFEINPGSSPLPDFPDALLELKTAAVKPSTGRMRVGPLPVTPSAYQSKERLKLAKINYMNVVNETWESNSLFRKCANLLLLLSLFDAELEAIDRLFVSEPILWNISDKDIDFIMRDWNVIVDKIRNGEADKLSGSDTYYLEACTSGTGKLLRQPNSDILAKERSFAFKASFVDASFLRNPKFIKNLVPLLDENQNPSDLETVVLRKLNNYKDVAVEDIALRIGKELSRAKHRLALLTYGVLGIKSNTAEEFVKAGIEIKTVNLNHNGSPKEDTSFPAFSYMDIIGEEWEDSIFNQKLETKLLFVVFQTDKSGTTRFLKAGFWTMPQKDIAEAKKVWEETKLRVTAGTADDLPRTGFNSVAFVRNHARNSKPESWVMSPKNGRLPVKGFWLNRKYVKIQLDNFAN